MLDILRQTSCTSGPSKSNSSWKGIVSTLLLIVKGSISIPIAIIYTDRASTRAAILVFRGTLRMLELRIPDARAMQTQDDRLSARSELRLRDAPQNSSSRCEPTTGTGTSASLSFFLAASRRMRSSQQFRTGERKSAQEVGTTTEEEPFT